MAAPTTAKDHLNFFFGREESIEKVSVQTIIDRYQGSDCSSLSWLIYRICEFITYRLPFFHSDYEKATCIFSKLLTDLKDSVLISQLDEGSPCNRAKELFKTLVQNKIVIDPQLHFKGLSLSRVESAASPRQTNFFRSYFNQSEIDGL